MLDINTDRGYCGGNWGEVDGAIDIVMRSISIRGGWLEIQENAKMQIYEHTGSSY